MAEVQKRLPNRDGMTTVHALWPGRQFGSARPDVDAKACMKDCAPEPKLASFLPDFARNAHGNLADQNRLVGAQLGADTTRAAGAPRASQQFVAPAAAAEGSSAAALALARQHNCTACHALDGKLVGPSFKDIAGKHGARADAQAYFEAKIKAGGQGVWGDIPMPAQSLPEPDTKAIAQWLATGAAR
jgi:cytochrome c